MPEGNGAGLGFDIIEGFFWGNWMAVYSMTGYANAASDTVGLSVEARSVNGRFLDLALRLPDEVRGLEPALREQLTAAFKRGKIELRVATQREADGAWPQPQPDPRADHDRAAERGLRRLVRAERRLIGEAARPDQAAELERPSERGADGHEREDEGGDERARRDHGGRVYVAVRSPSAR